MSSLTSQAIDKDCWRRTWYMAIWWSLEVDVHIQAFGERIVSQVVL